MSEIRVPSQSRERVFLLLAGVILGSMLAGLAVPLVFGSPLQTTQSSDLTPVGQQAGATELGEALQSSTPGAQGVSRSGSATAESQSVARADAIRAQGQASAGPLGATDRGVSGKEIKWGILVLDTAGLAETTGAEVGDPEEQWLVYFKELNARGGILGRKIKPIFRRYDATSLDDMRAACVYLTQDAKVFAVSATAGFSRDPALCVAEQNDTPFVYGGAMSGEYHRRAPNRIFTPAMNKDRNLKNQVAVLHRIGWLKNKKIGIVTAAVAGDIESVDQGTMPALKQFGYTVTHRSTLSSDPSQWAAQIPVEVEEMKRKGVEVVLNLLPAGFLFVQEAEAHGFYPKWSTSDLALGSSDGLFSERFPDSFDGSLGITMLRTGEHRANRQEPALDAKCREIYSKASGRAAERGSQDYVIIQTNCAVVRHLELALLAAGTNLTRDTLAAGFASLGAVETPYMANGRFAPGKPDAADMVRIVEWRKSCRCWNPITDFERGYF